MENDTLLRIRKLLEQRNWSLYRLSKNSGVAYSSLNSLFQKNNQPTLNTLERICAGFQISLNEFFSDDIFKKNKIDFYSDDEKMLIEVYRSFEPSKKMLISEFFSLLTKLNLK